MAKLPKTPKGQYTDIRRRFLPELPDPEEVQFHWVDPGGQTELIDTRCMWASAYCDEGGTWHISLSTQLQGIVDFMYLVMGHECNHLLYPRAQHNDAEWNEGYRRLVGAGFFRRIF